MSAEAHSAARPAPRRIPLAARFGADRSGATAIEFGFLAVPFLATILALFEMAYVDFMNDALQNAVSKAARQVLTGQVQAQNISNATDFVNQLVCPSLGNTAPTMDCSQLIVDLRTAASFAASDMSRNFYAGASQKFCPGQPGQVVVLRIAYPLPAIFPLSLYNRFVGLANDVPNHSGWYHILMGSALFQEEPYNFSYATLPSC